MGGLEKKALERIEANKEYCRGKHTVMERQKAGGIKGRWILHTVLWGKQSRRDDRCRCETYKEHCKMCIGKEGKENAMG